ncbi:MFS general substrate transporter [Coniochaeta ligniaria NRRL 30616]|uniref:MFS general substrate transporter n=1 Tax=Coniochaeta ligniaria NRRL 30616 TaxID=1408157 RepID=A0A1J7JP02_9PEZI|nr:MFS general substrate transporter [Coniochaeta ligniaria NRRL 30616]
MASDQNITSTREKAGAEDEPPQRYLTEGKTVSEKGHDPARDLGSPAGIFGETIASDEDTVSTAETETRPVKEGAIRQIWHWKPSATRYDPDNPPKFTVGLNILFALAGAFTVATLYYNQAILFKIADTFHVSFEKASTVATLMQAGYATGLLFICPLGDLFRRRPFIIGLVAFTATLWLALCLTTSFVAFQVVSFLCGVTTVTPQLMLPLVGDLAPPARRASSLAIVVSGMAMGMMIARLLSGIVANYTDWRNIYWFGFGTQYLIAILLFFFMPDYPSKNPDGLNYFKMMYSIFYLLFTEPLLLQAALITYLTQAIFTSYWTTLSFLLSQSPYNYSSIVIGLFGLIGIVIILTAPIYSRLILDKIVPLASAIFGLLIELVGVTIGTFVGSHNVAGPVIQAVTIDIGAQFANIALRSSIYTLRTDARNRINTGYMLLSFCGQLTGTAVGNRLFAQGGWTYSGGCSIGFVGLALIIAFARGPRETGWLGWGGGWRLRRDDLPSKKNEPPSEQALEELAGAGDGGREEKR